MNFVVISDRLEKAYHHFYRNLMQPQYFKKHLKQILFGLLVIAAVMGGAIAYRWHTQQQDQAAFKLFKECALLYKRALVANKSDMWVEMEAAAKGAYTQAKSSNLAPYLLMYQVQALKQQGKSQELAALITLALKKISHSSPLYTNFKLIEILNLIDTKDAKNIALATKSLAKLAHSSATFSRDMALFYLGEVYSYQGRADLAKTAYTELVQTFKTVKIADLDAGQESPWVKLATERLQNL